MPRSHMTAAGVLAAAIACAPCGGARADVQVPPLERRVTDLAGALPSDARARIERTLADFEARKGAQIAVLVVETTAPEEIEQYAIRVADAWKLGRAGVDDGALLLVATRDRRLRIEVGYGLEGVLPDAIANRIIDQVIVPRLRAGDLAGGIEAGVDAILRTVDGEPLPAPAGRPARDGMDPGAIEAALVLAFVLVPVLGAMLRPLIGRLPAALVTGGATGWATWFLLASLVAAGLIGAVAFLFTLAIGGSGGGRRGRRGPIGGWPYGGGGGFGGGGASGSW